METAGIWKLGREIGKGAYGVVYLARNAEGGWAAVKICRKPATPATDSPDDPQKRYERERRGIRLYAALPPAEGLVRLLGTGEIEDGFYSAFELADDEFNGRRFDEATYRPRTLASVIAGEKALPLETCVKLGVALARGLETLQLHHLLHRDIKPGNILYVNGKPVLSDPGLLVDEATASSLVGTPGYTPPESFVTAGGDVYSLGLTLKAVSFGRTVDELEKGPALEADTASPAFARWWQILNKATEKDESRRYQSAKAFAKDLAALRGRAVCLGWLGGRALRNVLLLVLTALVAVVLELFLRERTANRSAARNLAHAQELADKWDKAHAEGEADLDWMLDGMLVNLIPVRATEAQTALASVQLGAHPWPQAKVAGLKTELAALMEEGHGLERKFTDLEKRAHQARQAGKSDADEKARAYPIKLRANTILLRLTAIRKSCDQELAQPAGK